MGCCDAIAKYILFLLNFTVFVCGAVILGVGIALIVDDSAIDWITDITGGGDMNDDLFRVAVYTMLTVGSLLFLVGFFGCCGACKESSCMLQTYAVMVSILLLAEIIGGILAAVFISEIDENLQNTMLESVKEKYSVEETSTTAWDAMQIDLKCCGSINYEDYENSVYMNETGNKIPASCCVEAFLNETGQPDFEDDGGYRVCLDAVNSPQDQTLFFQEGCYVTFKNWVEENSKLIMGILFGMGGVQLIALLLACCLKGSFENK